MKKQKVLYILGAGYSGSTLLGLSLGTLKGVINLGEVASIENDYRPPALCTCNNSLENCEFWSGLKQQLEQNQKSLPATQQWQLTLAARREELDKKGGGIRKLLTVLGVPFKWLFSKKVEINYLKKNESFFKEVFNYTQAQVLIDLSKTPERLNILKQSERIDLYCVYLKRNPRQVFASNLKRPKKSRAHLGFKVWREAIWYGLRFQSLNRIYRQLPNQRKTIINWEHFTQNPVKTVNDLVSFFGLAEEVEANSLLINPQLQHVYSGNLWLHRERPETIRIEPQKANRKLSPKEEQVLENVMRTLGLGRELDF